MNSITLFLATACLAVGVGLSMLGNIYWGAAFELIAIIIAYHRVRVRIRKKIALALVLLPLFSVASLAATSPSGTTIPPAQQIVDSNGGVWTVASNGLCYLNGQWAKCSNVQTLLFNQNNIFEGATDGTWWLWTGSGWNQLPGDPRSTPSASGTTIPSAQQIVDSNGGIWTVG
ncbi:MAG TPA: hypothetical protein VME69_11455, partial [Methylocella sp.]|nr:hypothetical protein [Methylocella sp.]